jgi:hypothetical protein
MSGVASQGRGLARRRVKIGHGNRFTALGDFAAKILWALFFGVDPDFN